MPRVQQCSFCFERWQSQGSNRAFVVNEEIAILPRNIEKVLTVLEKEAIQTMLILILKIFWITTTEESAIGRRRT